MKNILTSLIIFLVMLSPVLAIGQVDITSLPSITANPGDTATFEAIVANTVAATTIPTVNLASSNLAGSKGTITSPTITSITNLISGAPQARQFTLNVPFISAGTYTATLTASESGNPANKDTIAYELTVNSVNSLDVLTASETTALTVSGQEDEIITATVRVQNKGSNDLKLVASEFLFNANDFKDSDEDTITLTFSSVQDILRPNEIDDITLTIDIANNVDLDTYSGIIELKDAETGISDKFKLDVRVQPEVCEDGIRRNGQISDASSAFLQIDVNEPDNGDEFAPGETIDIEVNIENNNDDPMDVVVEAFLYNLDGDDEIERVTSDSVEIDDGDDDDFDLSLDIPSQDLDEDDEYILFIKAFDDGNEDENCNEDSIDIDIEREDHKVVVESFTVLPNILSCNDVASMTVTVLNIGSKDERDILVEVKQPELGISESSEEFDLNNDDDAVRRFTFTVPDNAQAKDYTVEAVIVFDDGDERESKFTTFKVESCVEVPDYIQGSLSLGAFTTTKTQASIPVTITNEADQAGSFKAEITGIENWASSVSSRTVSLQPGQSTTIFFYPQLKKDLPDTLSAVINLYSEENLVDSKTTEKEITKAAEEEDKTPTTAGVVDLNFGDNGPFWIIADIVLIILAVLLVKALFTRRK